MRVAFSHQVQISPSSSEKLTGISFGGTHQPGDRSAHCWVGTEPGRPSRDKSLQMELFFVIITATPSAWGVRSHLRGNADGMDAGRYGGLATGSDRRDDLRDPG